MLRSLYGYSPAQFADFVEWLAANPRIALVDQACVLAAVDNYRAGLDFADALHLAQARGEPFLTLDRKLLKRSAKLGLSARNLRP